MISSIRALIVEVDGEDSFWSALTPCGAGSAFDVDVP